MPLIGPILYFRGQHRDHWRLTTLLVREGDDAPPPLRIADHAPIAPRHLTSRHGHGFWRHDFSLPLVCEESVARYTIGEQSWSVHLPALHGSHRLAFTACSGTEDESGKHHPEWRNALWHRLAARHTERPFHLLIHGGDQLYADTLWQKVPALGAWRRLPWHEGNAHAFTPEMAEGADTYYFDRYATLWSQPDLAPILAAIPSMMMWDDHDIFDGWGSWPAERQRCPVFTGVFATARDYFALFQLAARPDDLPESFTDRTGGHFGWVYRAGRTGLIAPDLRSERSRARVMDKAGRQDFRTALESLAGCEHVVLLSSVPLTNAEMPLLERILVNLPGHQDLEDDLRDQWQSFGHRGEWTRMLATLVDFSARTDTRITSVSGEIHMGALGLIEDKGVRIHEFTASGIVHPPPPRFVTAVYEWFARRDTVLDGNLRIRRLPIPVHGRRYLRARNFLSLSLMEDSRIEAVWHTEHGETGRFTE